MTNLSSFTFNHPKWATNRDNDSDVDKAKQYPIEKLYEGSLKRAGRLLSGLCPFHKERTPSFIVYTEDNHWYCFAESIGGDSISFYMKKTGCNFIDTIKALQWPPPNTSLPTG